MKPFFKWVLRDEKIRDRCVAVLNHMPVGEPLHEVIVRPYKEQRSLQQNATMWRLVDLFSRYSGGTRTQVKDDLLAEFFGSETRATITGQQLTMPRKSSSELSVEEMSEFLTWLESFAHEWGVYE